MTSGMTHRMATGRWARSRRRAALLALTPLGLLAACSQVEPVQPTEPITDPTQLYLRLTLNHPAINLTADSTVPAYNEVQLVATPYDGTGAVIADAPAATFTVSDTGAVRVDATGLLHAKQAANGVKVVAALVLGGVRHTDTALVNISSTATPPMLDTFSVHVPADSAVWYVPPQTAQSFTNLIAQFAGLTGPPVLPVRVVDGSGTSIPSSSLAIAYAALDSAVAVLNRWTGEVTPLGAGYVPVVARTYAYGVAKADTMTYVVNAPFTGDIAIDSNGFHFGGTAGPTNPTLRIVAGGVVGWYSFTAQPMDVTFDDPTNVAAAPPTFCAVWGLPTDPYCSAGNLPTLIGFLAFRQFPVPGTYPFHSTTTGATGKVIVFDRVTPLP